MEQIGRYTILGEIGRGAMGVVYRAQDPAVGRIVALKTIRLDELADASERDKLRERLMREAQSAGRLSHPGIVTIFDVAAEQDGLAYISMECVEGPTLERMLLKDPPDGRLVLSILTQTAAALDYAHKRGIVHRDIKPANIMMHERIHAKITDFGVARIQSNQMTQAGSMVGTPNYMSPEQIQGQPVDGRSDQFSLAVIAYELLTGEKPFAGDSIPALAFKIVQEDPAPAHRLNPTLEWPVDTVLKRALSKKPEDRYPTCSDFAVAIENACRTSKGWKPVMPGLSQTLPTMAASNAAAAPAVNVPRMEFVEPPPKTPRVLRYARNAALMVLGFGLIAVAMIGGLRWFDDDLPPPAATVKDDTVAGPPAQKPTPFPPDTPAPERPKEEPLEAGSKAEAPAVPKPEIAKVSSVRLITNPPGANLVVDGNEQHSCKAPCSIELSPGRHTLAATMDGYRRTLRIFEMPGSTELFLNLDRTSGNVIVRSEPRGATIVVDGQTRSEKTPAMLTLPTGRHTIEVTQDGEKETHEVMVRESVITNLSVNLQ
jgi:serine/threonine-protein kinase